MAGYEDECCIVCISLFNMSEGKGRALETWWNSTTFGNTTMEIG